MFETTVMLTMSGSLFIKLGPNSRVVIVVGILDTIIPLANSRTLSAVIVERSVSHLLKFVTVNLNKKVLYTKDKKGIHSVEQKQK